MHSSHDTEFLVLQEAHQALIVKHARLEKKVKHLRSLLAEALSMIVEIEQKPESGAVDQQPRYEHRGY